VLEARDLRWRVGDECKGPLSFMLRPREILVISGRNGSGKSTLLDVISGFASPLAGNLFLNGMQITSRPPWKRATYGLRRLLQTPPAPEPELSVKAFLSIHAEVGTFGLFNSLTLTDRMKQLISLLELDFALSKPLSNLSYGSWRLIQIVAILSLPRGILLLDEPFAGIDPRRKSIVLGEIQEYAKCGGCAVIATHPLDPVDDMASKSIELSSDVN